MCESAKAFISKNVRFQRATRRPPPPLFHVEYLLQTTPIYSHTRTARGVGDLLCRTGTWYVTYALLLSVCHTHTPHPSPTATPEGGTYWFAASKIPPLQTGCMRALPYRRSTFPPCSSVTHSLRWLYTSSTRIIQLSFNR